MNRRLLALCIIAAAWVGPLHGAPPGDPAVAALYARGLAGNAQAVIDCIAALEKRLAEMPNDQLARVYLGSAFTLRSRDLGLGKAKLDTLRKGLALMDEAVAAAPGNADVALTRAVTNEALPIFLGRRKVARAQLNELLALVEKDPAKLRPADRQLLYLNAGEAARHTGDKERARDLWQRGLTIRADAKLNAELREALARLE
jgi:tetratricopeptide (TPR) repeat protein